MSSGRVETAVQRAFKDEWGRVVATLIRRTGDWDLAEECAQDAFTQALTSWAKDGVPAKPGAWLTTVAGNRALDRLRRGARGAELLEQIAHDPLRSPSAEEDHEQEDEEVIEDDRLRLMFTCCHPALALEARVALTLRTLAGLSTAEIARAFLVPEPTMAKRLVRAKAKIGAAAIPYRVPPPELLPERTPGVLAVLYLLFNEGYSASSGDELIRAALCDEAIRLARVLCELMPEEPEAEALLALMLLQHSRRDARVDAGGYLITLEDQDRERWHHDEIAEAERILGGAPAVAEGWWPEAGLGSYRVQAEIARCHAQPQTDWVRIRDLYTLLAQSTSSPVVQLNLAVAVAMAGDLEAGLTLVDELAQRGELASYHLLAATRADLLRRRGELTQAAAEYQRALALAPSEAERRFLQGRISEMRAR
ncbi:MAG TPA: sigma-70 family RNA polymerase sigma factor [Solirubrobacteraceae bacterium]|jgi:RNA polymerase sigma-70 factor (ECF subfamily)|nr:sigma-70 family RNA polymerase sigma factor [Solirubrobacteraceae bacterium]